jgi:hypothetical protein
VPGATVMPFVSLPLFINIIVSVLSFAAKCFLLQSRLRTEKCPPVEFWCGVRDFSAGGKFEIICTVQIRVQLVFFIVVENITTCTPALLLRQGLHFILYW